MNNWLRVVIGLVVTLAACSDAEAARYNRDTDWMAGSIGVFRHQLYGGDKPFERMRKFNSETLAEQLADIGVELLNVSYFRVDGVLVDGGIDGDHAVRTDDRCHRGIVRNVEQRY